MNEDRLLRAVARWGSVVLLAAGILQSRGLQAATFLLATNDQWRVFKGWTEPSLPDTTGWRQTNFVDAAWEVRAAPFHYGEKLSAGTTLGDMKDQYSTVYLRKEFEVASVEGVAELHLDYWCDDGLIVWINGRHLTRYHVDDGEQGCRATANELSTEPPTAERLVVTNAAEYLVAGRNVIAVQALNAAMGSSDFLVSLALWTSAPEDLGRLVVQQVIPPAGEVGWLAELTVVFNRPVRGVDASDLLINGRAASAVEPLSSHAYRFSFEQLAGLEIEVTWAALTGIEDWSEPPLGFEPAGPGGVMRYRIVDQQGPRLSRLHPLPGTTVRVLREVRVTFDEPVAGLVAGDLKINGQSALGVSGSGAGPYVFALPSLAPGRVVMEWSETHAIHDLASPANRFAGGRWAYQFDPSPRAFELTLSEFIAGDLEALGLRDEDGSVEDWIELRNTSAAVVSLAGWALTDEPASTDKWVLPERLLGPGEALIVFASGKDRAPTDTNRWLHTNFKLSRTGEYLALFSPDSPRQPVVEFAPAYPRQANGVSYGQDPEGNWKYYSPPTPGWPNGTSDIAGAVAPVHFSVPRGLFREPFLLHLSCPTPGSLIRFTTDGSKPTAEAGAVYAQPILVTTNLLLRTAAFHPAMIPSETSTHSYVFRDDPRLLALPVVSVVTDTNHLWGRTGILGIHGGEYVPREGGDLVWAPREAGDYHNPSQTGLVWERPVSLEWLEPGNGETFQADCGLRVHGSEWYRPRLRTESKFSFRVYFRGDYGETALAQPILPDCQVAVFDCLILRAGHNDFENPFLTDELMRRLYLGMGHVSPHGAFVHLLLNGAYKGYYNVAERIDGDFLRSWHGGTQQWDVVQHNLELREGDAETWKAMLEFFRAADLTLPPAYEQAGQWLDLDNFIDYLLVNLYGDTGDWTHDNWVAARPRLPGGRFRFYMWDAEFALGIYGRPVDNNTLVDPVELGRPTEISLIFNALKRSPEFCLRFADRVHRHFFNRGALTDEAILLQYTQLRDRLRPVIPNFLTYIEDRWVPNRRQYLLGYLAAAGLFASEAAPLLSQPGGKVPVGFPVVLSAPVGGTIYYTLTGGDPRVAFDGHPASEATVYSPGQPLRLARTGTLKARTLRDGRWSALVEARFEVGGPQLPVRITEIMYNPVGGDAFEFFELQNLSSEPVDMSGVSIEGVDWAFGVNTLMPGDATWVLASSVNPAAFLQRYAGVRPIAFYGGRLANGGERLGLRDSAGHILLSVDYDDANGWPPAADGFGYSLELTDVNGDPDDPANWSASAAAGGTPGNRQPRLPTPTVRLNELMVLNTHSAPNSGVFSPWVELYNLATNTVELTGWSLTDNPNWPRKFVFPMATRLQPAEFLLVWLDAAFEKPGLHAGFGLDGTGGALFLFDAVGGRVDAVSFGAQVADYAVGRDSEGSWRLTLGDTAGKSNVVAAVAGAGQLCLNEWLANPPPGQSDWLELFNASPDRPAAVQGMYVQTSRGVSRLASLAFLKPRGYLRLWADENPGRDHLDVRLRAEGDQVRLLDAAGEVIDQIAFGAQSEGISMGRLPDGAEPVAAFPGSASPGAPNYVPAYRGPVLNELMAFNVSAVASPGGGYADWVELANASAEAFDLSGMGLGIGGAASADWVFPTGVSVPGEGFLVVWCDETRPPSLAAGPFLNCGRGLPKEGGTIQLLNPPGQVMARLDYGPQGRNLSLGRVEGLWKLLGRPTPGEPNGEAALLGEPAFLRVNEWLAGDPSGPDWLEIYNPQLRPVSLAGLYLTDNPSLWWRNRFRIPDLSFVGPQDWAVWIADAQPGDGPSHLSFSLNAAGEGIWLFDADLRLLHAVSFGAQKSGVAAGFLPDGAADGEAIWLVPSPGEPNAGALESVVINEVLAEAEPPFEPAIELLNTGGAAVELGGWYLSDDPRAPKKHQIPPGTVLPGHGSRVFYQGQWGGALVLDRAGPMTVLLAAAVNGELTGWRAMATFGPVDNGVSAGRWPTSEGGDFTALRHPSFGVQNPASVAEFRLGQGEANAQPLVGPIVVNEVLYDPDGGPTSGAGTNATEFIELLNLTSAPVALCEAARPTEAWRLENAVRFSFPAGAVLAPGGYALVVPFDPRNDSVALWSFLRRFAFDPATPVWGPYEGKLSNEGDSVELTRPQVRGPGAPPQLAGPQVLVDRVAYKTVAPWPTAATRGRSIQRVIPTFYGNEPCNWADGEPTPGQPNRVAATLDSDQDGIPNVHEMELELNPYDASDAALDFDADGLDNRSEFLAGTNPREARDALVLRADLVDPRTVELGFLAKPGRAYRLLWRESLAFGAWELLAEIPTSGTERPVSVRQALPGEAGPRFFRLEVPPRAAALDHRSR